MGDRAVQVISGAIVLQATALTLLGPPCPVPGTAFPCLNGDRAVGHASTLAYGASAPLPAFADRCGVQ
jgi:hypothetical protein